MIAFIPRGPMDIAAADAYVQSLKDIVGNEVTVVAVGQAEIDWRKYGPGPPCHPTPYGYRAIAQAVYDSLTIERAAR